MPAECKFCWLGKKWGFLNYFHRKCFPVGSHCSWNLGPFLGRLFGNCVHTGNPAHWPDRGVVYELAWVCIRHWGPTSLESSAADTKNNRRVALRLIIPSFGATMLTFCVSNRESLNHLFIYTAYALCLYGTYTGEGCICVSFTILITPSPQRIHPYLS